MDLFIYENLFHEPNGASKQIAGEKKKTWAQRTPSHGWFFGRCLFSWYGTLHDSRVFIGVFQFWRDCCRVVPKKDSIAHIMRFRFDCILWHSLRWLRALPRLNARLLSGNCTEPIANTHNILFNRKFNCLSSEFCLHAAICNWNCHRSWIILDATWKMDKSIGICRTSSQCIHAQIETMASLDYRMLFVLFHSSIMYINKIRSVCMLCQFPSQIYDTAPER